LAVTKTWAGPPGASILVPSLWSTGALPSPGDEGVLAPGSLAVAPVSSSVDSPFRDVALVIPSGTTLTLLGGATLVVGALSVSGHVLLNGTGELSCLGSAVFWEGAAATGAGTLRLAGLTTSLSEALSGVCRA
jgi:hypothetical protein